MVFKCCVVDCDTGKVQGAAVFAFPDQEKKPESWKAWFKFVNRKNFKVTNSTGICEKHFKEEFIRKGKQRNTLIRTLNPIPTIQHYSVNTPLSVLPTPSPPTRKPPLKRSRPNDPEEDELRKFLDFDKINQFSDIDETYAPDGFSFKRSSDDSVVFYELATKDDTGIPFVETAIQVDRKMHVKLFHEGNPVPQPEWFRKNNNTDCKLTSRGMLVNFVSYVKASVKPSLLDELQKIRNMQPKGRPPFSAEVMRFALRVRYTSKTAYDALLEEFPLPSLSVLQKLCQGGKDSMKAAKLLLEKGEIDRDVVLMLDEMHLQKEESFQGGSTVGKDENGELYKGVLNYMIVGIRKNIPFVVRAVSEVTVSGGLVRKHIDEVLNDLHTTGFNVRTIVADNHSSSVVR